MLRLAVIGDETEASSYDRIVPRLEGATLIAAAGDVDPLFESHGREFDAVLIHSAADLHEAHATRAALAGKHVLVQSPLALDVESAERIAAACRRAEVCLMVGRSLRFVPSIRAVCESWQGGQLGAPGLLRIHRWEPQSSPRQGESFTAQLVNELDLACWFFRGIPNLLYASGGEPGVEPNGSNYAQLHLGFEGGGMALIDVSTSLPEGEGYFSLSLIGSTGAAYADDHHNMQLLYDGGSPAAVKTRQGDAAMLAEVSELVAAVDQNRKPLISGTEGRIALSVAAAAAASLASGQAARWTGKQFELESS